VILGLVGEFSSLYVLKNFWGSQLSMLLVLFGLVLYLAGPSVIRITWLPIVYLVFAIPLPEMLYNRIALPMQNLAAQGSMLMLRAAGVNITSDASALHLISRSGLPQELTVAEACSGMHLLMAFMALGVAMAYLDNKPLWQRLILVCAGVPIAIFCNVLRVAITAWMFYIDKAEMGTGFMHAFTGIVMLIPALVMLWLLARILKMMIIEVDEEPQSEATQAKG
jgi:exosortase